MPTRRGGCLGSKNGAAASSASPDLLGRTHRSYVRRSQSEPRGGRRVVWADRTLVLSGDKTPLDVADRIKAPMLGLYGGADGGIPNDTVEKMGAALKAAGNTRSEMVIFPDMPHAFYADYRPNYRPQAADEGWRRLTAWFKQYLS